MGQLELPTLSLLLPPLSFSVSSKTRTSRTRQRAPLHFSMAAGVERQLPPALSIFLANVSAGGQRGCLRRRISPFLCGLRLLGRRGSLCRRRGSSRRRLL